MPRRSLIAAFCLALLGLFAVFVGSKFANAPGGQGDVRISGRGVDAKSALKIAFLGTSLTANYSWPDAVRTRLEDCTGHVVNVFTSAKAGETSRWGRAALETVLKAEPDLIFVEFSINDSDLRRNVNVKESYDNHAFIIKETARHNPETVIILVLMNRAYGVRRLLRLRLGAYENIYFELTEAHAVGLVDLRSDWFELIQEKGLRQVLPDGLHPTEEMAAQVVLARFVETVISTFSMTCN